MPKPPDNVALRVYDPELDTGFVYKTWKGAMVLSASVPAIARCKMHVAKRGMGRLLESLLERSKCVMACDLETPQIILGFCVYEPSALHYVHVKRAAQGMGIASLMLDHAGVTKEEPRDYTLSGLDVKKIGHRLKDFNPYEVIG